MCPVVDKSGQNRSLCFQVLVINGCGKTHKVRDARGEGEVVGVGIQLVPFEVIAQRCTPVREQFEYIGCGEIYLLLLIAVVYW